MFDLEIVSTLAIFVLASANLIPFILERVIILRYPRSMVYLSIVPLLFAIFCLSEIRTSSLGDWIQSTLFLLLFIGGGIVPLFKQLRFKARVVLNVDESSLQRAINENYACKWETMYAVLENVSWIRRVFKSKEGFKVSLEDGDCYLRVEPCTAGNGFVIYTYGTCETIEWRSFFDALFTDLRQAKPHPNYGNGILIFFLTLGVLMAVISEF